MSPSRIIEIILGSSLQLCTETCRALDSFVAVFESQYLTSNNVKLQQQALLLLEAECDIMVANTALKNFAFFKSWMYAIDRFEFCTLAFLG